MNSSVPHLSSLTVGEWSPEGLGGRLPPVRVTDRLKPRQPGEGGITTMAAAGSLGGPKRLLCLFEWEPEGSRGRLIGPRHVERTSNSSVKKRSHI